MEPSCQPLVRGPHSARTPHRYHPIQPSYPTPPSQHVLASTPCSQSTLAISPCVRCPIPSSAQPSQRLSRKRPTPSAHLPTGSYHERDAQTSTEAHKPNHPSRRPQFQLAGHRPGWHTPSSPPLGQPNGVAQPQPDACGPKPRRPYLHQLDLHHPCLMDRPYSDLPGPHNAMPSRLPHCPLPSHHLGQTPALLELFPHPRWPPPTAQSNVYAIPSENTQGP
jgi:hypothetical protein